MLHMFGETYTHILCQIPLAAILARVVPRFPKFVCAASMVLSSLTSRPSSLLSSVVVVDDGYMQSVQLAQGTWIDYAQQIDYGDDDRREYIGADATVGICGDDDRDEDCSEDKALSFPSNSLTEWCSAWKWCIKRRHRLESRSIVLDYNYRSTIVRPELVCTYCKLGVTPATMPWNYDHVSVFYQLCFSDDIFHEFLVEVNEFIDALSARQPFIEFGCESYRPNSFSFRITGELYDLVHTIRKIALKYSKHLLLVDPSMAATLVDPSFNDALYNDFHITWHGSADEFDVKWHGDGR